MNYTVKVLGRANADLDEVVERFADVHAATVHAWALRIRTAIADLGFMPRRFPVTDQKDNDDFRVRVRLFGKRRGTWKIYFSIDRAQRVVRVLTIVRGIRGRISFRDLA